MIDTVILRIDRSDFDILPLAYPHFSQKIYPILDREIRIGRFTKTSYNLSEELKQSGLYFPKFFLMKGRRSGGFAIFAHIEFSAPKLLFGNNFEELTGNELPQICETLSARLKMMGIIIKTSVLKTGIVATIHYGKNILFTDYTTASQVIGDLAKCDITIRKQWDKRDYINGGEALYLQTQTSGLVVYDKVQELKATRYKNGRFEEDNQCQFHLLDKIQQNSPFEVVRIEFRLKNRVTIRDTFQKYNLDFCEGRFCDVFSLETARTLLLETFSPFLANQNILISFNGSLEKLAIELKRGSPSLSPKDILAIIGQKALLEEVSFRDIRNIIGATSGQWSRIKQVTNKARTDIRTRGSIDIIRRELEEFRPIKMASYLPSATKNN